MRTHYHADVIKALDEAGILQYCPEDDRDLLNDILDKAPTKTFANPITLAWYLVKAENERLIDGDGWKFKDGKRKGQEPEHLQQCFYATCEAVTPVLRAYRTAMRDQYVLFLPLPRKW